MEFTEKLEAFRKAHEEAKERAAIYVNLATDPRDRQEIIDDLELIRDEALDRLNIVEPLTPENEVVNAAAMYLTVHWILQDYRANSVG